MVMLVAVGTLGMIPKGLEKEVTEYTNALTILNRSF